jgi:hypothetical protein
MTPAGVRVRDVQGWGSSGQPLIWAPFAFLLLILFSIFRDAFSIIQLQAIYRALVSFTYVCQ